MWICATTCAAASPWARPDDELLVITKTEYFTANLEQQDPAGGSFDRLDADIYVEYGLSDNVMLGGKAIYSNAWLTRSDSAESSSGFSQIEIFGQYEFLRTDKNALSARVTAARSAAVISGSGGVEANNADLEIAALYGINIRPAPLKMFAAAEAGYRRRFGDPADQLRFQATVGVEPHKRILFLAEAFGTYSLRNEDLGGADYDIVKLQSSLVARLTQRMAVQAGASKEVAGRNLARGHAFFIGFWSAF
ncbi:MAG: hypothetical protein R3C58_13770 [Parvularculaceae bacterium]